MEMAPRLPSVREGPLPSDATVAALRTLSEPHVQSFNFMLDQGLDEAVSNIPVCTHCHSSTSYFLDISLFRNLFSPPFTLCLPSLATGSHASSS